MVPPLPRVLTLSGRDSRAAFWPYVVLLAALYFVGFGVAMALVTTTFPFAMFSVTGAVMIGVLGLAFAAVVRRMHDGGWGAVWTTVYTLVLVGVIALMVRFEHGTVARQDVTPGTMPGTMLPTMLLMLVADVLGRLILIVCCMPGTNGPNAFGERPDAPLP